MSDERKQAVRRAAAYYADKPFERASDAFDCVQFARRAILEVTGRDVAADVAYANAEEADAILADHGGMMMLVSKYLGDPVKTTELDVGDIGLVVLPNIEHLLGVITTRDRALVPLPRGLSALSMSAVRLGWKV